MAYQSPKLSRQGISKEERQFLLTFNLYLTTYVGVNVHVVNAGGSRFSGKSFGPSLLIEDVAVGAEFASLHCPRGDPRCGRNFQRRGCRRVPLCAYFAFLHSTQR